MRVVYNIDDIYHAVDLSEVNLHLYTNSSILYFQHNKREYQFISHTISALNNDTVFNVLSQPVIDLTNSGDWELYSK